MPDHHMKGQPAASTYVRKKGCVTFDTNRDTPCIYVHGHGSFSEIQGVSRLLSFLRHPFSRTYVGAAGCPFTWWSGIVADLIFWKKILKFFFGSGSGPGTSPAWFSGSAWFWASSSSCYLWVFNFLAWKPLRMVNLTSKMNFRGQIYHAKWFSGQKVEYPWVTWTWPCSKPGWAWKPGWACTWPWPCPNK